jgi:hypothetical protein
MDYPSNSKMNKPEPEPERKIEKVITGEVVRKKQSPMRRFKDIMIGGDAESVWQYVTFDILIPAAKDTISDMVSMGIERILFGDVRSPSNRGRASGGGFTNYQNYSGKSSSKPGSRYDRSDSRPMSRRSRAAHNFDEIILETRVEAEEVIERMAEYVERYDQASVSDLYQLVGVTGSFADEKWGWKDLRGASVTRVRNGGYLLDLPRPVELD